MVIRFAAGAGLKRPVVSRPNWSNSNLEVSKSSTGLRKRMTVGLSNLLKHIRIFFIVMFCKTFNDVELILFSLVIYFN